MKNHYRILCLLLSLCLVLQFIPAAVFAEEMTLPAEPQEALLAVTDGNIGTGTPDGTPPVLKTITLSATEVTAPGTLEVIVDAEDDISGPSFASVVFYCKETGRFILVSAYRATEEGLGEIYPDGLLHGTLTVGPYEEAGTFIVERVIINDAADNVLSYLLNDSTHPLPEAVQKVQFTITASNTPDCVPPVLKSVAVSETKVTAPGALEVILDAEDDVSGVKNASVSFRCQETNKYLNVILDKTYLDDNSGENVPYSDGMLHGTLEIDQYMLPGTFVIDSISVWDAATNHVLYSNNNNIADKPMPEDVKALQFTVTDSENPDGRPPVMNSVFISATKVTAPGTLELTMDAKDDVSGLGLIEASFYCKDTDKFLLAYLTDKYWDEETKEVLPYPDGLCHGTLYVDQYVESGTFLMKNIYFEDQAGNSVYYTTASSDHPILQPLETLSFRVFNTVPDVTTSLAKPGFVEEVENAGNSAYIAADYSGDATMPKEAFQAIAGTDKTIDLISDGITWRFDGSDITGEIKDIDLQVDIRKVEEDSSASGEAIEEILQNNPGVVMKFPENGTLPGKATIQVKVDHAMREYLGSDTGLCVYYYNNATGKLELIAEDLTVVNDTYVEFEITHCSYYVLAPALDHGHSYDDHVDGTCNVCGVHREEVETRQVVHMFRMYNPNTGEHFYTGSEEERDNLIGHGWHYEGIGFTFPANTGAPVHRLFQPSTGEHLYTMDEAEKDQLMSDGWNYEGIAFNSAYDTEAVQHRLHNPNATVGAYHFTFSLEEKQNLITAGWEYQGIGWYSCWK